MATPTPDPNLSWNRTVELARQARAPQIDVVAAVRVRLAQARRHAAEQVDWATEFITRFASWRWLFGCASAAALALVAAAVQLHSAYQQLDGFSRLALHSSLPQWMEVLFR